MENPLVKKIEDEYRLKLSNATEEESEEMFLRDMASFSNFSYEKLKIFSECCQAKLIKRRNEDG